MEPIILGENKDDAFSVFPIDIWVEIMCRLPDKPLHRFKCVSKNWCFLISQVCIPLRPRPVVGLYFRAFKTGFREAPYASRAEGVPVISYFTGDWIPVKEDRQETVGHYASLDDDDDDHDHRRLFGWGERATSFSLPFTPDPDDLIDCCNGLHLFFDTQSFHYYVCNPFNKQCELITLPESTPRSKTYNEEYSFNAALVFEPCKSPHYKVVRFDRLFRHYYVRVEELLSQVPRRRRERRKESMFLDIYHSANRIWSRHSVNIDPLILEQTWVRYSAYFNGSLFRLSYSWHLIQFDFVEEIIDEEISARLIELPLTHKMCQGLIDCIGVLMGKLCYANEYQDTIHIWSLDEKKGWTLTHMINIYGHLMSSGLVRMREGGGPYTKWVGPVSFHPSSNIIFLGTPVVILSYNLDNNKLEELIRMENNDVIVPGCYMAALPYVRLLSPFGEAGNIRILPNTI